MSSFQALNYSADSQVEEESHTRELQIEEGFKVYEQALVAFKEKRYDDTETLFKKLFQINIITEVFSTPAVDMLRYLAYKNRAMFKLETLQKEWTLLDAEDQWAELVDIIDDLMEALQHSEGDHSVTKLLYELCTVVKSDRLKRLLLEYELGKDPLLHRKRLMPQMKLTVKQEFELLKKLHDQNSLDGFLLPVDHAIVVKLDDVFFKDAQKPAELEEPLTVELTQVSWGKIAEGLKGLIPKSRTNRIMDGYNLVDYPINSVMFEVIQEAPPKAVEVVDTLASEPIEQSVNAEETNDLKRELPVDEAIHRSSKRLREEDTHEDPEQVHTQFLQNVDSFLENLDKKFDEKALQLPMDDFKACLKDWANQHAEFLHDSGTSEVELSLGTTAIDTIDTVSIDEVCINSADVFLKDINGKHYHFIRLKLLQELLKTQDDGFCFLSDCFWGPDLFNYVTQSTIALQANLYELDLELDSCVSVLEILLNHYILLDSKKLNKASDVQKQCLETLERWIPMVAKKTSKACHARVRFRYQWVMSFYDKHVLNKPNQDVLRKLSDQLPIDMEINNANCTNIPRLHKNSVDIQLNKVQKFAEINQILVTPSVDALEGILLHENELSRFVNESPDVSLRLKLWKLLLEQYKSCDDYANFFRGYIQTVELLMKNIISSSELSGLQRHKILLSSMGFLSDFSESFMEIAEKQEWKIEYDDNLLDNILKFFRLLYVMVTHESISGEWFKAAKKSSKKLQNLYVDLTCILYMMFRTKVSDPELLNDFLSILHEPMGNLNFCDGSGGKFLRLSQRVLIDLHWPDSFFDFVQLLWCQYHFELSSDTTTLLRHETEEQPLDTQSAIEISKYLMPIIYKGKNPLLVPQVKADFKFILESITEIIGDPPLEDHLVSKNAYILDRYLNGLLTTHTFRDSFYGKLKLPLEPPQGLLQTPVELGIYFVAGVNAMNLYKNRKKQMQARPSELQPIAQFFKNDLLYCPNRYESWFLLGQCYSFIVEDDLIWTSDKITTANKKSATAACQRKALLCYFMAHSVMSTTTEERNDTIAMQLYSALSKEMYNACYAPMDKLAFHYNYPTDIQLNYGKEIYTVEPSSRVIVSDHNIIEAMIICFRLSNKFCPDDWANYYYLSKLYTKMNKKPAGVLKLLLKSCMLAGKDGLEAHYRLVSLVYKYVKSEKLTEEEARGFLRQDELLQVTEMENESDGFPELCINLCKKVMVMDKKKMLHRPKFRIAKIYFDLKKYDLAKQEMETMVVLKSTTRNLINIWKPDFERPGRHFMFVYDYISFYLDIAHVTDDTESIYIISKKLRSFAAGMVGNSEAFDKASALYRDMINKRFEIDEKTLFEEALPMLNFQEFIEKSKLLLAQFDKEKYDPKHLELLVNSNQFRKYTIAFDGFCIAIYLKFFYLPFATPKMNESAQPNMAFEKNNTRKRVSKKDALSAVGQLVDKKIT